MFQATDGATARRNTVRRTRADGSEAVWWPYMGRAPGSASADERAAVAADPARNVLPEPQVYLVEQPPEVVFRPHFHFVDQFQLVTAGAGHIGRHAVRPFSVHFAAASTGYGPITPDRDGIHYMTIRARSEITGANFLPESRDRMPAWAKRNLVVDEIVADALGAPPFSMGLQRTSYVAQADGLAVVLLRVGVRQGATLDVPEQGGGRCAVVLHGGLQCRGSRYGPLAVLFTTPDEPPLQLVAGESGVDVLLLQFPRPAQG